MSERNTVEFEVYGDYALFSDPITRVGSEKFSYQVPTYEAIKGILHSVYYKPTLIWFIDEIRVLNPIQTQTRGIRLKNFTGGNDLANYTYLKNVRYQVRAHFEWNTNRPELEKDRNEHKHHNIAKRMIERGGRRDVFLGVRECQGYVIPCEFGEGEGHYDEIDEISFNLMLHGFTYADEAMLDEDKGLLSVRFWNATMKKGVIKFIKPDECKIKRHIKKMDIKRFDKSNFTGLNEFEFDRDEVIL